MSNVVTWSPALSAAAQATIARHQELQKLVQQREDMFKAIANKIKDWGDVTSFNRMDKFANVIADQQLSVDTVIDNNEYDYVFGEDENQNDITVSKAFQDMIAAHNACFTGETQGAVAYTANKFKNNLDIIYASKGVAGSSMASCFEGCYNLLSISDDIDWSAATNLNKLFASCDSLQSNKVTFTGAVNSIESLLAVKTKIFEIEFTNCQPLIGIQYAFNKNSHIRKISGLNLSLNDYRTFLDSNSSLTEIRLKEGSYIRYCSSICNIKGTGVNDITNNLFTQQWVTPQIITEAFLHTYDWTNNANLDNLTDLVGTNVKYTRTFSVSSANRAKTIAYAKEHELFNCTTADDDTTAEGKITTFLTGRGWSW